MPAKSERNAVAAALESTAGDHRGDFVLERASGRGRWEDVPNAIRWAIAEEGVEMGLLDTHEQPSGYVFELITVEGWPATLTVQRTRNERVYEAAAQVGRFHDLLDRRDRAEALLRAFDDWMAVLGAKPQLVPRN